MHQLFEGLEACGLAAYARFDLSVVRGLAYYTGVVFELFDTRGELRAICGGGRYDDLLRVVSGNDLPALGLGMGDVVLRELLASHELLPSTARTLDNYVVGVTRDQPEVVLRIVHRLRDSGRSVDYSFRPQGVGKQLKNASALNATRVVILGPDELAEGVALVRTMESGEEARVPLASLGEEAE